MDRIAPGRQVKFEKGSGTELAGFLKKATAKSRQQNLLKQAVRMTEMPDEKLNQFAQKMSEKDKQTMLKAISTLGRVADAVQIHN